MTAKLGIKRPIAPVIPVKIDPNTEEENWRTRARCRSHSRPDLWFPAREEGSEFGVWECLHCPVLARCREYAIANREPHGTWGGLSEWDRQRTFGFPRAR